VWRLFDFSFYFVVSCVHYFDHKPVETNMAETVSDTVTTPTVEASEGSEMRILVTGGAGFIGSHVCEALLR
jgi:hypothetical protein